jgi:hypothetical protein
VRAGSIAVAYLHAGEVSHSFHRSIRNVMQYDLASGARQLYGFIEQDCGAGRITDGRNDAVRQFMQMDAEWLAFVDSDMGFEGNALHRLVESTYDATDEGPVLARLVVGALAFGQRKGAPGPAASVRFEQFPTIYRWHQNDRTVGAGVVYDYPRDTLVECDATGAACFVVHRSVLQAMASAYPEPRPWFDETIIQGRVFGEDLTFFRRIRDLGYPVHVHTGVKTSHHKQAYLTEETQPSVEQIPNVVVIPMKGHLDLTMQLVERLAEQRECDRIVVMDNGSDEETRARLADPSIWPAGASVAVVDAAGLNIHQMWNHGMRLARQWYWPCNVAILNNDLRIGDRFLSRLARALRTQPLMAVVSPNYDGRSRRLEGGEAAAVELVEDICAGRYDGTGGLAGFAFMLRVETGYQFPEQLNWWYGDNDLIATVLQAGHRAGIVLDAECEHIGGGSQTAQDIEHTEEFRRAVEEDRRWFVAKWKPVPDPRFLDPEHDTEPDPMPSLFTDEVPPPSGRSMELVDPTGTVVRWTGKRWYDPLNSDGSLQTQEAWPPSDLSDGPWRVLEQLTTDEARAAFEDASEVTSDAR